jgi:phosphatidylglycerophosphatase C
MVDRGPARKTGAVFRPLVAFDFDGTLTWRDSFTTFLAWRAGARRYATGLARLAPAAATWLVHRDRGRLKAAVVREFLAGAARCELEAEAQRFAGGQARRLLRPDALRCWQEWQARGARLVIVTATPETIVAPFAHGLGADALIGTRLAFDADGRATGSLDGPNCRGDEKVARLRDLFGAGMVLEAAYGDSDGDSAMLGLTDQPGLKIFAGKPR